MRAAMHNPAKGDYLKKIGADEVARPSDQDCVAEGGAACAMQMGQKDSSHSV